MPNINKLSSINLRDLVDRSQQKNNAAETGKTDQKDFGDTISDFLKAVNDSQKESASKVQDVITGRSENLHEAMVAMEESQLSFKLMLEIRNKLLESYQELQRLQV